MKAEPDGVNDGKRDHRQREKNRRRRQRGEFGSLPVRCYCIRDIGHCDKVRAMMPAEKISRRQGSRRQPPRLLMRNERVEPLVGVRAGLIHRLLLEDQILHGLADEIARFRISDDG